MSEVIIELARLAGIRDCTCDGTRGCLERFAEQVIQAERDRLARECAQLPFGDTAASFAVWIRNGGKA